MTYAKGFLLLACLAQAVLLSFCIPVALSARHDGGSARMVARTFSALLTASIALTGLAIAVGA